MSATGPDPTSAPTPEPTEEELRAAYEAEIKKIRVEHVLLEHVVTLINLGMRRTGLSPGTEAERDPEQVRLAVEAVRAVVPLVEQVAPAQAGPIRDALSQLQLAFVRIGGQPARSAESQPGGASGPGGPGPGGPGPGGAAPGGTAPGGGGPGDAGAPAEPPPPKPGEPGPAQRSGRLWIPGQ